MINFNFKLLMALVAYIATGFCLSASDCLIKGVVVDSVTNEREPFVTYRILRADDMSKVIATNVTDLEGNFKETISIQGNYKIYFSALGKYAETDVISITTQKEIDLGKVILISNSSELNEVVVTAHKPIVQTENDRLIYNAAEDPANKSNTVIEMLRKVPMVSVDGNNNITLKGSSNFKIYINGRPDPMLDQNAAQILKSMPATSVKKIEVITDPGAKFDAEGIGGIINIITDSGRNFEGYLSNVDFQISNRRVSTNLYARTKINKVTVALSYAFNKMFERNSSQIMNREDYSSEQFRFYSSNSNVKQDATAHWGNLQISYEPDSLNLFTLSGDLFFVEGSGYIDTKDSTSDINHNSMWNYRSYSDAYFKYLSGTVALNYQHTFKRLGHNLILSYYLNKGEQAADFSQYHNEINNYPYILSDQRNSQSMPSLEHTFQIDYTNPINDLHTLEFGGKAIIRRNDNDAEYYLIKDNIPTFDSQNSVSLSQQQDVFAIYGTYNLSVKKFNFKAGVRYEHTRMGVNFKTDGYDNYSSNLNDLVPNAMVLYKINDASNLRLSYQMKISRPGISMLNPYKNTSNPIQIEYGNPELSSMRINNLGLTYSNFAGKLGYNISLEYSQTDNQISQYTYVENGIQYSTYDNLGKCKTANLNVYANYNITSKMRFSLNGTLLYVDFKHKPMNLSNSGWTGSLNADFNYEMPWKLRLGVYGGFGAPGVDLQGSGSWWKYYGFNISRNFLKEDRLTVTVNANDLFLGENSFVTYRNGDNFKSSTKWSEQRWNIGISVSYRFGGLKHDVKKVNKTIMNDDIQQSQSNGI